MDSILTSVKRMLGIMEEDTSFDMELIIHVNSALSALTQLGVGPEEGFYISNEDCTWDQLIPANSNLEMVKSYVYLKVQTLFDPPTSPTVATARKESISELEFRIMVSTKRIQNGGT